MSFSARYRGWCSSCGEQIEVGDLLTYEADGAVHVQCPVLDSRAQVCTTCWLEKPCTCDDEDRRDQ